MLRYKALEETVSLTLLKVRGCIAPIIGPITIMIAIAQIRITFKLNFFLDLKAQIKKSAEKAPTAMYPNSKNL